jgi:hypothetical protein
VRLAVNHLRARARCTDEAQRERLARRFPALHQACQLFMSDGLPRWTVEARLLAGEDFAAVARKCQLEEKVVEYYHEVFFSVQGRLDARDFVTLHAVGPKAYHRALGGDLGVLLKLYGYNGGSLAVDAVLDCVHRPPVVPEHLAALDDADLADLGLRLAVQASLLTHQVPADASTAARLLMLSREFGPAAAGETAGAGPMRLGPGQTPGEPARATAPADHPLAATLTVCA